MVVPTWRILQLAGPRHELVGLRGLRGLLVELGQSRHVEVHVVAAVTAHIPAGNSGFSGFSFQNRILYLLLGQSLVCSNGWGRYPMNW